MMKFEIARLGKISGMQTCDCTNWLFYFTYFFSGSMVSVVEFYYISNVKQPHIMKESA